MANKSDSSWLWLLAIGGGLWLLSKATAPALTSDVANGASAAAAESLQADHNATIWDPDQQVEDPNRSDMVVVGGPDGVKDIDPAYHGWIRYLGPPLVIDDYTPDKLW